MSALDSWLLMQLASGSMFSSGSPGWCGSLF